MVWTIPSTYQSNLIDLVAARLVSTPSTDFSEAWLGIAISRTVKVSPNLSSSTPVISNEALNSRL
ncbi:hypothetical protein MTBPR1_60020 [Candidatus Terasakiella magnetica]|uniref:Uncharacterized protein n=1 Tax=Candidatus Terasakiella magnetica TaxID=1867952 RepID=A0A1C3RJU9_9PROT|nr:hypothetical protein MTBPR1_60020 [Candidatus Terasakiella magnetica]